jgi:Fic family protein
MIKISLWTLVTQLKPTGNYQAFVPNTFPPDGFGSFSPKIHQKSNVATRLIGKLDGITKLLPDADFFLLMYLRKDAASSSQIEGTRATMIDAIEAEAMISTDVPPDVDDILNYIKALNYGMKRVTDDNFPVSLRFIRELHNELMKWARATHFADPGNFRTTQNWIGGSRPDNASFVPPPPHELGRVLGDLENFMHTEDALSPIVRAGILHAQFETIHPFLDGNGRTGRMLITFYLWKEGCLEKPVLFLSSYFKRHQQLYYDRLSSYHDGDVELWLDFFLDGVIEIAQEGIDTVQKITDLRIEDSEKIQSLGKRAAESAMPVLRKLYTQPIVNSSIIQSWTQYTWKGAQKVIDRFIALGILVPKDLDKKYGQSYIYKKYVDIFSQNS